MNTQTINNKILLVEDDPQDMKMMLLALAKSNLANHVKVVRDGAEALDYLYHRGKFQTRLGGNPDLVLLDNKMPKGSGLQVLNTIKTSSSETQDLVEFFKHGVPKDVQLE
jgi:CheY-like chemotaxis protein